MITVVPTVIPGYDNTDITHIDRTDHPVLSPSPERYRDACEIAVEHAEGPVFATSFNEWYEDTLSESSVGGESTPLGVHHRQKYREE